MHRKNKKNKHCLLNKMKSAFLFNSAHLHGPLRNLQAEQGSEMIAKNYSCLKG